MWPAPGSYPRSSATSPWRCRSWPRRPSDATRNGLAASVWSADPDRALAIGRRITSGALFVNAVVSSDPRLPFGGTKHSGYGRELGLVGGYRPTAMVRVAELGQDAGLIGAADLARR